MHKKPTGTPYHFSVTVGTGGPPQEMAKNDLQLPQDKAGIERLVATQFAADARDYDLPAKILAQPVQNEENDIDFTVETNLGPMGLELVEYAPVGKRGFAGPKPTDFSPVERGRQVIGLIAKKNKKYRHYKKFPHLMLLIYVTDNAWALDHFTLRVIQFLARTANTVFDFITYYKPMVNTSGIVYRLYPVTDSEYEELGQLRVPSDCRRIL
ncbi:MAG: hypothetical protein PHT49_11315 [Desulfovibrionales bacterium]|nr:hypothetical protein [Desulfovibrionales bacterium]